MQGSPREPRHALEPEAPILNNRPIRARPPDVHILPRPAVLASVDTAALVVLLATAVGALARFQFHLGGSFPIGDGGMFATMVDDLRRANFALPEQTSYNGSGIPLAYPPLALYIAAMIGELTGFSSVDVLFWLPPAVATLTVPAFYLLARVLSPARDRSVAVLATVLFAVTPGAFVWQIVGGGLTRSFGFLFALLALYHLFRLVQDASPRRLLPCVLFAALTALSHLEAAWLVGIGFGVFLAYFGRTRRHAIYAASVGLGALLLTSPWWGTVLVRHGADPFIAAFESGEVSLGARLGIVSFLPTHEGLLPIVAGLGFTGFAALLISRQSFLPVLLTLVLFFDPRGPHAAPTALVSILAAYAILSLISPAPRRALPDGDIQPRRDPAVMLAAIVTVYALATSPLTPILARSPINILPVSDRTAMAWIQANTPEEAAFVVVSAGDLWELDVSSEWFPALAGRRSLGTVQGTEWFRGDRGTKAAEARYDRLIGCAHETAGCLEGWAAAHFSGFTHVYVSDGAREAGEQDNPDCCALLRYSLINSPAYRLLYEAQGVQVFEAIH